jgi:AhpD family alkylhydroperoxidase
MSNVRLNPHAAAPKAVNAMLELSKFVENSGLERSLLELVKIRASQINGCAYCIHMHVKDALKYGESELRLHLLAAWRESSLYSAREQAALAWTEALTRLPDTAAPDADYEALSQHFSPEEQVKLTLAITVINSWNRIAVGFRSQHPQE